MRRTEERGGEGVEVGMSDVELVGVVMGMFC